MDTTNYVINEAAARALDWTPIRPSVATLLTPGRKGRSWGGEGFHFESMHQLSPTTGFATCPSDELHVLFGLKISGRDPAAAAQPV